MSSTTTSDSNQADKQIQLLVHLTGKSKDEAKAIYDELLVKYPQGYLTKEQFGDLFREVFGEDVKLAGSNPEKFIKILTRAVDKDKNGQISFYELFIGIGLFAFEDETASEEEKKQSLQLAFDLFDLDGNQKITKEEFSQVFGSFLELTDEKELQDPVLGGLISGILAHEIFKEYDTEKKGYLTKDEFVKSFMSFAKGFSSK